jgi:hypothetical protein
MPITAETASPSYRRITQDGGEAHAFAKVKNLAAAIRMKKQHRETFVLMLGAGASLDSGVPPTSTIMRELVEKHGNDLSGSSLEHKFDQLWKNTTDKDRKRFLEPYLSKHRSPGYDKLAELIERGYFDLVLTFNFDDLLEDALKSRGFHDTRRLISGETSHSGMQKLLETAEERFKLVKLHGSLNSTDYFVFDLAEAAAYPPPLEDLVRNITRRDIIVCGYAFNDECVTRAFSPTGDSIYCVNPGGVPLRLSRFLPPRRSETRDIRLDFDTFFSALHRELLVMESPSEKPPPNPFKFLEGYHEGDGASFKLREEETEEFFTALESQPAPRVIVIAAPAEAGKTSFVHAGILSRLDTDKYLPIYFRSPAADSRVDIEAHLRDNIASLGVSCKGLDLPGALGRLAESSPDRKVLLILDQFERVTQRLAYATKPGKRVVSDFLNQKLFRGLSDNLILVLVATDEAGLGTWLPQQCYNANIAVKPLYLQAFTGDDIVRIMEEVAADAGFQFDRKIIEELAKWYEQYKDSPLPDKRFTLTHIQAICHILAGSRNVTYDAYTAAFHQNLGALNQAINVSDITSFVEDCAWPNSAWCRNMIKVPLQESKDQIAAFVKAHYEDLVPPGDPPGTGRKPDRTSGARS